ncbi:uncharacterized protein LOC135185876 [Pogoniulus pusillus]|uniref:uncharacterized protein LOC135185876 n=1 Tax=Pogoniulus pusillus TaxID=488313 RepID=UPI0030B940E0
MSPSEWPVTEEIQLATFPAEICCGPQRRMSNLSCSGHRVIWPCTLPVDTATDWLPGRKSIHQPLCLAQAQVAKGCPAGDGELGSLDSFLAWWSGGAQRRTRRNTATHSCGHWELRQQFSPMGPDCTASTLQIPSSGKPLDVRPRTVLILRHPRTRPLSLGMTTAVYGAEPLWNHCRITCSGSSNDRRIPCLCSQGIPAQNKLCRAPHPDL